MPYHFARSLLLRMPAFPASAYSGEPEAILRDPFFQAGVFLASPLYYKKLADAGFLAAKLSAKERNTLVKYYNRSCFRPTPFGLFASISLGEWGKERIVMASKDSLTAVVMPDQLFVFRAGNLLAKTLDGRARYTGNPTLYRVGKEYRFISTDVGGDSKRNYQLQSTCYSQVLKDLLQYCRQPRPTGLIIQRIGELARTDEEESKDYYLFLVDSQVLVAELRPSLTGKNHLATLFDHTIHGFNPRALSLRLSFDELTVTNLSSYADRLHSLINSSDFKETVSTTAVLFRRMLDTMLSERYQDKIRQGLFALNTLLPPDVLPAMSDFTQSFLRHFDGRRISLLTALDPECGIGYQEPAAEGSNSLLETVNIYPRSGKGNLQEWTAAHACLMDSWIRAERKKESIIHLEEAEIQKLPGAGEPGINLGLSVLFRISGGKVFLESCGGNNAHALAGRFTVADQAIAEAARQVATEQEALNPGVIFAEVLHLSDPHTDNVNRRTQIWSHELPLTAVSLLPISQQIFLEDLFVEVNAGKVYLWSEKHGKYVIPRLTTAYNHSLNKLPLFRFLADLPYQYGRSQLSFDLRRQFPGQSYYPRVEYQDVILSPATWVIAEEMLTALQKCSEKEFPKAFKKIARTSKLSPLFAIADGDQQLVFHKDRKSDINFLKDVVKNRKELILTEYYVEELEQSLVKDWKGSPYVNQFSAFVLPDQPIPVPLHQDLPAGLSGQVRKFMPGTEWLYLKIYSPKTGADKLLLKIRPLLNKKYAHGKISRWFFIRYEEQAPHIRLRLKIDPEDIGEVLLAFKTLLEDHVNRHVIREYQIDIYTRELERYKAAGIALTEDFFWSSSMFVMQYLLQAKINSGLPDYVAAIISVKAVAEVLLPENKEQLEFFRLCYEGMLAEFESKNPKMQLDLKYRELSGEINRALQDGPAFGIPVLDKALRGLQKCAVPLFAPLQSKPEEKGEYLHSLFHMHLNRLFSDQQRLQEMVIYYLLYKFLVSAQARSRRATQ